MKTLKLKEHTSDLRGPSRGKTAAKPLPGETPALPLCLIDTQTLRTLKVEVNAKHIAAVPPPKRIPVGTPALSLAAAEGDNGYDPYNNFGESAATRRRPVRAVSSRH